MNTKEYDQKKQECWEEYFKHVVCGTDSHEYWFNKIFDCAFALGKEKEPITQEEIEKVAQERADNILHDYRIEEMLRDDLRVDMINLFKDAIDFALGKQEKDAEKRPALTDKEVYALESAISELESLMDGTLDEDYHKEQKSIINALKRIIKKYEKK